MCGGIRRSTGSCGAKSTSKAGAKKKCGAGGCKKKSKSSKAQGNGGKLDMQQILPLLLKALTQSGGTQGSSSQQSGYKSASSLA